MANVNKVLLVCRLTRDPEIRQTTNSQVVNFGVAVNNRRKNAQNGQWEDDPVFVDCEAWDRGNYQMAKMIGETLSKGQQVFLEGHLRLDQWTDKNDGSKRSKLKLVVDNFQYLEARNQGGNSGKAPAQGRGQPQGQARRGNWGPQESYGDQGSQDDDWGNQSDDIPF